MQDPIETSELLAFARTVEAESLSGAAVELGVPRATVGRRLARMERRLGVRLIRRTTRSLVLTEAGTALYQRARAILEAVRDAEASVQRGDDRIRGRLRVSVPPVMPDSFHAMVADFIGEHPDVRLELSFASRHVDLLREGYDLALRAGTAISPGLVGRTLSRMQMVAVASPAYLRARGTPRTALALASHTCLMGYVRGEVPETHWPLLRGGRVRLEGALFSNDLTLLFETARRGRGIALLPEIAVEEALQAGTLVAVLPRIIGARSTLMVVHPERELVAPAVRAFSDAIAAWSKGAFACEEMKRARGLTVSR